MAYEPVSVDSLLLHQDWALRLARRLVREDAEAEDIVQRTWVAALRRPPDSERGARAWIRKVILNLARERHRRGQTRERHERALARTEGDAPDTLEILSHTELRKLLSEQLLELKEPYRSVVLQRYYDGLSSVEIARRLGIPPGTVRWRLKVGLDQLRAELDRRSHGDRSRWVSALLALLPPGTVADEPDGPDGSEGGPAHALAPSVFASKGWIALAGVGVLGLTFLIRGWEPRSSEAGVAHAGPSAERLAGDGRDAPTRANAGSERSPLAGRLAPGASSASGPEGLQILVVDGEGAPVSAARIQVASASGFEERTTSDEEGRAWLVVRPEDPGALGLPATRGRVAVRALAEGRAASALVHVAPPFTPAHEVRIHVGGRETRLTGRVVDDRGRPVPAAIVAWFDADKKPDRSLEGDFTSPSYLSAVSDAEGSFVLANLPSGGRGNVGCLARGFAFSSLFVNPPQVRPIELVMDRGASVSGTVRWPDGRPAAGVIVGCEPLLKAAEWATGLPGYDADWRGFGEATRSDEDGRFRIEGVKAGHERVLWARDPRSGLVASAKRMLENDREELWDAMLAEHSGFRLRIVDEVARPLPGWIVNMSRPLEQSSWWVRRRATDADGRLIVTDCPDGEILLDVLSPAGVGAPYAWRRLQPSNEEVVIEVETRATSSISGRVLNATGEPELRGRLVFHAIGTTVATAVERDVQGNFEQRLAPGAYGLALELERTAAVLSQYVLTRGQHQQVGTLTTPEFGTLRMDATALERAGGKPFYALHVLSKRERERGFIQVPGGPIDGELVIPMFPGRYRVLAFDGSGEKPLVYETCVQAHAETRLELGR